MGTELELQRFHPSELEIVSIRQNISRPYALFADNMADAPQKRFKNLKRIWKNRRVIFVEGAMTRYMIYFIMDIRRLILDMLIWNMNGI